MTGEQRFYSEEEAQQILHHATQSVPINAMSRDELIRAAGEMGIAPEAIEKAEAEIAAKREAELSAERDERLRKEFNRYYRGKVFDHMWGFISSNLVFIGIWFFTGAGYFWPLWIFGFWGFSMIGGLGSMLFSGSRREKAYAKWLARRQGLDVPDEEDERREEQRLRRERRRRWRESRW